MCAKIPPLFFLCLMFLWQRGSTRTSIYRTSINLPFCNFRGKIIPSIPFNREWGRKGSGSSRRKGCHHRFPLFLLGVCMEQLKANWDPWKTERARWEGVWKREICQAVSSCQTGLEPSESLGFSSWFFPRFWAHTGSVHSLISACIFVLLVFMSLPPPLCIFLFFWDHFYPDLFLVADFDLPFS